MIRRERVLNKLAEADPAVVSLVAPPGYGKTTLLAQWTAAHQGPVVWLTLDAHDNDALVLVSYLGAALDRVARISPDTARALSSSGRRIFISAMPRLMSEMHAWKRPGLIVFDDAHLISERMAVDVLSTLLDHLPPGVRLAVAGRYEPDLPFGRLAAQRDLVRLGPADLALDARETSALVSSIGYELTSE
jgi:LuxR family maltose regulon positive regulatory protein